MSFTKLDGIMTAALLIVLGSADGVSAQQGADSVGIVRITDGRPRSIVKPASGSNVQQVGGHRMGYAETPCQSGNCQTGNGDQSGGYSTGNCPTGNCPTGNCPGGCPSGGCFHGKFGEHYCKHSPDYGYSPPAKYPLHRRGVQYTNYYPMNWYGAGADYSQSYAPMVYQPTDTTQLGYRYQHVPFWQPMPGRLPPRPVPSQWHNTLPPYQASRYSNGMWPGHLGGFAGNHGWNGGHHGAISYSTSNNMNGSCPPNGVSSAPMLNNGVSTQPIPPQPLVTSPQPLDGDVVPPIQSMPNSGEFDDGFDSDLPEAATSGIAPGTLPPLPTSAAAGRNTLR